VGLLHDVIHWFNDPAHWRGTFGIPNRLGEHLRFSVSAIVAGIVLAVPIAAWLGHKRRYGTVAANISNVGRAIPSFAILVIGTQVLGFVELPIIGSFTTFVALTALAIPPLVTNSYTAVAQVDDDVIDAARGMGLSEGQVLCRVELPLAAPLLMAGIRTTAVQVVATATIAAFVGVGGLGRFIIDGQAAPTPADRNVEILAGAILVAALSLLTELGLGLIQRKVTPKGIRTRSLTRATATAIAAPPQPVPL
jgi:osmoprotectant transport system permease protein